MYSEYHYENEGAIHTQFYIIEPILEFLNKHKPKRILDLGCGNGSIANELIKRGYNVYGIDASQVGIDFANSINENRFFYCDFSKMELPENLPIKKFDMIISTEVIEHVYSPALFMDFCKLALENEGNLLISTPYHGYLKNLLLSLFNKMDHHFTVLWEGGHIKFWSKNTLGTLLLNHGFNSLSFIGCGRVAFLWKTMIMTAKFNNDIHN